MLLINTLLLTESGGNEGLGFAVPVDLAAAVVKQLRYRGWAVRAYIGLELRTVSPSFAVVWGFPLSGGFVTTRWKTATIPPRRSSDCVDRPERRYGAPAIESLPSFCVTARTGTIAMSTLP